MYIIVRFVISLLHLFKYSTDFSYGILSIGVGEYLDLISDRSKGGTPLQTKIFLISCSFLGKSGKFVC